MELTGSICFHCILEYLSSGWYPRYETSVFFMLDVQVNIYEKREEMCVILSEHKQRKFLH